MNSEQQYTQPLSSNSGDEISLYDLYKVLAKHLKLIVFILVAVLVGCGIYLLLTQKVYQANAIVSAPSESEIYLTNIDIAKHEKTITIDTFSGTNSSSENKKDDVTNLTSGQIFNRLLDLLVSGVQWQKFMTSNKLDSTMARRSLPTGNPFTFAFSKDGENHPVKDKAVLHYTATSPQNMSSIIKSYLQFTQKTLAKDLTQQLNAYLTHERNTLKLEILVERESAKHLVSEREVKLAEEVDLAKKLGILKNLRVNFDDHVNAKSLEKQHRLALLSQVQLTQADFRAYHLDGNIVNPSQPIRPRTKLILVLGVLLGLFLGVFAAFTAEFIARAREQDAVEK